MESPAKRAVLFSFPTEHTNLPLRRSDTQPRRYEDRASEVPGRIEACRHECHCQHKGEPA